MTTPDTRTTLPEIEALIRRLDWWRTPIDPCDQGHVEHTAEDHFGPEVVHTYVGTLGADWSRAEAEAFIRAATVIEEGRGHLVATANGRTVAFAVKP